MDESVSEDEHICVQVRTREIKVSYDKGETEEGVAKKKGQG